MEFNSYKSIKTAETALEKRGYNQDFTLLNNKLINQENGETYQPEDLILIEHHRFPSNDKWQNTQIIFALEDQTGKRGLVKSTYGRPDYMQLINFMDKVKVRSSVYS